MDLARRLKQGEKIPKAKIPDDVFSWRGVTGKSEDLGVFSHHELSKLRALIGEERYEREMNCNDSRRDESYYYKREMRLVKSEGRIRNLTPLHGIPLRYYYDLGIGNNTDRTAIGIFQFSGNNPSCLWAQDYTDLSYHEVVAKLRENPLFNSGLPIIEHVLPHDVGKRQQSDKVKKVKVFRDALRSAGVPGTVRVQSQPKDVRLDTGIVREVLRRTTFNDFVTDGLRIALNKHRKAVDADGEFTGKSSKTKYRDYSDMFRGMCVDIKHESFAKDFGQGIRPSGRRIQNSLYSGPGHPEDANSLFSPNSSEGVQVLEVIV